MNVTFHISAAVAVLATIMVITRKNAVHALLYLIVSLLAVAVIFYVLGAPYIAALEVIIYAGAIMVLFVFVIMMVQAGAKAPSQESALLSPRIWIGPSLLCAVLLAELVRAAWGESRSWARRRWSPRERWGMHCSGLTCWESNSHPCCSWPA